MTKTDPAARRPTLHLQRPLPSRVERDEKTGVEPLQRPLGAPNRQTAQSPKPASALTAANDASRTPRQPRARNGAQATEGRETRLSPKLEFRQWHPSGPTTPILIDAREISWLIEGGDTLIGRTIVGHRDDKQRATILNHSFIEVNFWWQRRVKSRFLELTLAVSGRRAVFTARGLRCARTKDGVTFILPRSKGATLVPVDMPYGLVKAWIDTNADSNPKPKGQRACQQTSSPPRSKT